MGFNKATQNGRYGTTATTTRVNGVNGVNGRPTHSRSKSQAPRPRTAHAIREEERHEPPASNGTTGIQLYCSQAYVPLPRNKTRNSQAFSTLSTIRDSSLTSRFNGLSLEDNDKPGSQAISRPSARQSSQSSIASHISNIPCKRRGRVGQNDKIATSQTASSEWA
jgi:kinesin family protein C1